MRRALGFLTVFGGARAPTPSALAWFPVVGAGLGLALGGLWWVTARAWTPAVAAALVVAGDLIATGMLHFDGLADSADGLLPHLVRSRRLEVMSRPDIGAFGVTVVGIVLLLRWVALASLRPQAWLLASLWCLSRSGMAMVVETQPYARASDGGMAGAFSRSPGNTTGPDGRGRMASSGRFVPLAAGLVASVAFAAVWRPLAGAAAVLAGAGAMVATVSFGRHRLGGFTGDVLGAGGVMAETVGLLVASAKW